MATTGDPQSVEDVDVFAPETIENWYPTYELLQQECPVYHVPDTRTYFLTRYDEVYEVLRRTELFKRGAAYGIPGEKVELEELAGTGFRNEGDGRGYALPNFFQWSQTVLRANDGDLPGDRDRVG